MKAAHEITTVAEALESWDAGESVWSIEMGGIGPGYEQCIQILAFEIMRDFQEVEDWDAMDAEQDAEGNDVPSDAWVELQIKRDDAVHRMIDVTGSPTGAQLSAATNIALCVCRRGYDEAVNDPGVKDRRILVSRRFPS